MIIQARVSIARSPQDVFAAVAARGILVRLEARPFIARLDAAVARATEGVPGAGSSAAGTSADTEAVRPA